jgi:ribosomal-protein-alanine N-acetyltransferase
MSFHPQVRLVPATVPLLNALDEDRTLFCELIGSPVPDGWPEFPEAIGFTLEHLQTAPEPDRDWSMQFFIDSANGRLLGSGGFAAPPVDRTVEIGYEVAPEFRVRGSGPLLLGLWSSVPLLAARSTTSSRTRCQVRIRPRACSYR